MEIVPYVVLILLVAIAIAFAAAYMRERGRTATLHSNLSQANAENIQLQEKVMEITRELPARRELEGELAVLKKQVNQMAHLRRLGMVCRTILQREEDFSAGVRKAPPMLDKDLTDQIRAVVEKADREAKAAAG